MNPKQLFYGWLARRMGYLGPEEKTPDALLAELLAHAAERVPYYRDLGISADPDRLADIPFLTKDIMRAEGERLVADDADRATSVWNTSGGSTGEPVRILQDRRYLLSARRATHDQERMTGYRLGDRVVKLWGDERELLAGALPWKARVYNLVKRQTFLNAFLMTPERMETYLVRLRALRPQLLIAYAQALYELARFAEERGERIEGPRAVMTSAGTLYPFMREQIERVTGTRVFNRYGSREVGNIAMECASHDALHIADRHVLVEIVGEDGKPCPPGVEGEIVVTSLANHAMPIIRYRIGDYGAFHEGPCACGYAGPALKDVVGRVTDAFRTPAGKVIPAEYFIHIVGVVLNRGAIRKFQVIQQALDRILVKAVPAASFTDADEREIRDKVAAVMDPGCMVTVKRVEEIPALPSGKYRYTIREIP